MKNSFFTREHPIVLGVYLLGGMIVTMTTMHPLLLCSSFLASALYGTWLLGKTFWKRTLGILLPILFFAVVVMPLFSHNGVTALFYINGMAVTLESVLYGLVMSLLLISIFSWFQIVNQLLDSEKLLYLSGRIFPSIGLLLSMVLRMLPLMQGRFREIQDGQRGMGRTGKHISWLGKVKLLLKELSILVSWSLESSIETSISMESRGYGTGKRTSFHLFHFDIRSGIWCGLFLGLYGMTLFFIGTGHYQAEYFPAICWKLPGVEAYAGMASFLLAAMSPLIGEGIERGREVARDADTFGV